MTISVVIPTLNEEQSLPTTLARAVELGFDEVIVVDGGSRDRTREIVNELRGSPVTLLTAPHGRAAQMNAGAAVSKGEGILFLHADTLLPPDARSAIERVLEDPAYVGGRFDVRFDLDSRLGRLIGRMINLRSRWTSIATGDQAMFVLRSAFERVGGFSDIPIMEDVDLSRRLKRIGRVAAVRSQVVTSFRRWDACGPIRTIALMWALRFLYWAGMSPGTLSRFYSAAR